MAPLNTPQHTSRALSFNTIIDTGGRSVATKATVRPTKTSKFTTSSG